MKPVFVGTDKRDPLFHHVMRHSVERHTEDPEVIVRLLEINKLPIDRCGATEFTFSRFLCPWLCDYEGLSIFCDNDQVVVGDITELFEFCSQLEDWDVCVMKDQARFEWPSVIVFNNENLKHLTPEFIQDDTNSMYGFQWVDEERVKNFPMEWNFCVGYADDDPHAKLIHWTQGPPYWPETKGFDVDKHWWTEYHDMLRCPPWIELHRGTKHFKPVMQRFLANYGVKIG